VSEPFRRSGSRIRVRLSPDERAALATVPEVITSAGDAGGRFDYRAHPEDPEAEDRYRDLVGEALTASREADRRHYSETLVESIIDADTAEAWMRVLGDARLALANRLGIEEDGWEEHHDPSASPDAALLAYLGYLQESLVRALG
jgi:hypothetical protein